MWKPHEVAAEKDVSILILNNVAESDSGVYICYEYSETANTGSMIGKSHLYVGGNFLSFIEFMRNSIHVLKAL